MFEVRLTTDAKSLFSALAQKKRLTKPGLMIHRQGPVGDLSRGDQGQAIWSVERRHPWKARVEELESSDNPVPDVVLVDEIPVWLALIPRDGEAGVEVSVRDGVLHVDAIPA